MANVKYIKDDMMDLSYLKIDNDNQDLLNEAGKFRNKIVISGKGVSNLISKSDEAIEKKKYERVILISDRLINDYNFDKVSDDNLIYINLIKGTACLFDKKYKDAIPCFLTLIENIPDIHPEIYLMLAQCYFILHLFNI